jgi:hypothetical protein
LTIYRKSGELVSGWRRKPKENRHKYQGLVSGPRKEMQGCASVCVTRLAQSVHRLFRPDTRDKG